MSQRLYYPVSVPFIGVGSKQRIVIPGGDDRWLWVSDYENLPLGGVSAANLLTLTGDTFTRASGSTVQTSSSSLIAGLGNDVAAIGSINGVKKGLVTQRRTQNLYPGSGSASPRNITVNHTTGLSVTSTANYPDSPDGSGTGCSRSETLSNGFANYINLGSSGDKTFSAWLRSTSAISGAGNMQMGWSYNVPPNGAVAVRAASDEWARSVISHTNMGQYTDISDSRDWSAVGGQTAMARDVLSDYCQIEAGTFPTEAIPTGLGIRAGERVSRADISESLDAGRMRFYIKFYPKHASNESAFQLGSTTSTRFTIWRNQRATPSNDLVAITQALASPPNCLEVRVNGTQIFSNVAMSWSRYDEVEVYFRVGDGVTEAWYRVNGGSWVDLDMPTTVLDPIYSSGILGFYDVSAASESADNQQMVAWIAKRGTLKPGMNPPGF